MGGERVAPHFPPHPVGRPHAADGSSCVGDVAPHVGGVAPTYAAPDGFLDPPCTP